MNENRIFLREVRLARQRARILFRCIFGGGVVGLVLAPALAGEPAWAVGNLVGVGLLVNIALIGRSLW